ncbi:MAG: hypothetical protein UT61_C0012G0006 [Candidatus Woesebacteria bacterium GW2011_GWA1_39_8]|uniref:Cupin type-2 domain-containing protein n=1 Tax=Candidatus Woesebacteria bacterium GW2011_GWA1_39_8 TaxID=1618552 RepID=A0A0G0PYI3_9BACT|nr:MAG: hypothetical protein UT61_C0012G0006 [Candidatus Woesebacteria bacterium GW2011_GWA1_39_8]
MSGYVKNIEDATDKNSNFRKVLFTAPHSQLVVMCLKPGEDIGMEMHKHVDQFLRIESGVGKAILGGEEFELKDGIALVVPAGTYHNLINTSTSKLLRLYSIYSPPNHPQGTVHKTKKEAYPPRVSETNHLCKHFSVGLKYTVLVNYEK